MCSPIISIFFGLSAGPNLSSNLWGFCAAPANSVPPEQTLAGPDLCLFWLLSLSCFNRIFEQSFSANYSGLFLPYQLLALAVSQHPLPPVLLSCSTVSPAEILWPARLPFATDLSPFFQLCHLCNWTTLCSDMIKSPMLAISVGSSLLAWNPRWSLTAPSHPSPHMITLTS